MVEPRRIECRVAPLQWEIVNCNNLILDEKRYCDILRLAKPEEKICRPTVEEDTRCTELLKEKEREKEIEEQARECEKLEIDIKYCQDKAKERREAIDKAKRVLKRDSHETKLLNRAVFFVDALEHNKNDVEEKRLINETTKFRETELELKLMKEDLGKDAEKRNQVRELRLKTDEDNFKIMQTNLKYKKRLDDEERAWAEEILCLSKEFLEEEKKKKIKRFVDRRSIDEANVLEIERKEKKRQSNLKLEEVEDRENAIFLQGKREMFKDLVNGSKKQMELREKAFDLVVEKTKDWYRDTDPEGVRDKWYSDLFAREALAKEKDPVLDVRKRREAYDSLVKAWDEQIERKMKERCDHELEAKLCHGVRLEMDCEMRREDEEKKKKNFTTALEYVNHNKKIEEEKKAKAAFEKQYDKEHLGKMYEHFASAEREQLNKRDCLVQKYVKEGKNTMPLNKLDFSK